MESQVQRAPTPSRGVPVELDRTRYLRYPIGTLRKLFSEGEGSDEFHLGRLLHAGLVGDDPELTEEQVEDMIDLEHLSELQEPLLRATGKLLDLEKMFPVMFGKEEQTVLAVGPPTPLRVEPEAEEARAMGEGGSGEQH